MPIILQRLQLNQIKLNEIRVFIGIFHNGFVGEASDVPDPDEERHEFNQIE